MNPTQIAHFFEARRAKGEDLVLATVFETAGSTYSKAGAYMVVDAEGNFRGILSGGCLEGDLAERAANVLRTREAAIAEYNLSADDELFGLGVGCEGTMRILLQPLTANNGYEPFQTINSMAKNHASAQIALVIESDALPAGAAIICAGDDQIRLGIDETVKIDCTNTGLHSQSIDGDSHRVLVFENPPTPRLLVLGAGMDAEPVVGLASELGWQCTVQDHRPAYIENRRFPDSVECHCMPAAELAGAIALESFDLAMVMSHHLATDTEYLHQLADCDIGYVGLLGPPHRRDRIVGSLDDAATKLSGRLHGPAGLDLGGRGPGPIALSIIAEMQRYLSDKATGE